MISITDFVIILKKILTLFGITNKFCPFFASPDSTFPMHTVPMSLYLSTIGIIKGPSIFLFKDGNSSMKGMNGGPSYHGHIELSIDSLSPRPVKPEQGMNVKSLPGLNLLKLMCVIIN